MVRDTDADRNESTGSISDSNRDNCTGGRARDTDASTDEDETRGGRDDCTGGGRHDGRDSEEGCAGLHRGVCWLRGACGAVCGDAAEIRAGRDCRLARITPHRGRGAHIRGDQCRV